MFNMKYNFIKIGDRLRDLRENNGYSQDKLIEILDTNYSLHIGRNTLSNIENGCQKADNLKVSLLLALADLYNCDVGYLLCEYDNITGRNTDIQAVTGLNDDSIKTLESLQQTDIIDNSITTVPPKKWEKLQNGTYTQQDILDLINCTGGVESQLQPYKQATLIDTLNLLLKDSLFTEQLLKDFRNLLNTRYTVPVYYDNKKRTFVYPNDDYSYTGDLHFSDNTIKGTYVVNLASSIDKPNDNAPLYLTDSFLESVALKAIENDLLEYKAAYSEAIEKTD